MRVLLWLMAPVFILSFPIVMVIDIIFGDLATGVKTTVRAKLRVHKKLFNSLLPNTPYVD